MSSKSKRPGTVDYSKWDNIECSDSESDDDDYSDYRRTPRPPPSAQSDDDEESEEESDYSEEDSDIDVDESESDGSEGSVSSSEESLRHHAPPPPLSALQRAWSTDTTSITRPCADCFAPNANARCSRCQLVRYCNAECQSRYHPIHRLECIDARKHASFWGVFDTKKKPAEGDDVEGEMAELRARRSSKRRRALQKAAAAAAIERATRARMARGGVGSKGGGGKGGKGADEREEECSICMCDFTVRGDGGVAFCCPASHYMCNECSGTWVNSIMGDLETSYPPRCPTCKAGISKDLVERQLTSTQQNTFRTHVARVALKPGQKLIECNECGLYEVVSDDPVLWWCPHCDSGNCRVCSKDLPKGAAKYDIGKSPHALCASLRKPKALIEQAIEEGSKMRCPSCELAGRKDDACTHMTCTKCHTEWCYVCGLGVVRCDKASPAPGRPANDLYLHNRDWEVNEKRCPMYLTQILDVDLHWLGENWEENATDDAFQDDDRCLDYLHRFRTIELLQGVREDVGDRAFVGTFVAFDSIKNCGYTCNEVITTCTDKLIDRSDHLQNREGVDGGQGDGGEVGIANILFGGILGHDAEVRGANQEDVGGGEIDANALEQHILSQAMQRSMASTTEDDQLREAMARSAESATVLP